MVSRIDCETLEKEDYEVSLTSMFDLLGSNFIRKLDVNEHETLLVSLDIDFKKLNIFDLKLKKRLSWWEYNIKGIEDSKCYTLCCSFDKKLILLGGEAGDLMQKTPLVTLHHFTEKMEMIDMLVIKGSRDPIVNLHADIHSGIIFATDISENIFLIRIGDHFNLQLLRILSKVQEGKSSNYSDYTTGFAYFGKTLYYSSLSRELSCIKFEKNENQSENLISFIGKILITN